MRAYEMTFILAPTLDDEGVKGEIEAVKKVLGDQGAEITAEKEWGRRRLAYPLNDHSEGVYHILRFSMEQKGLDELERYIKLNENLLRHLVILDEGTPLDYVGQVSESEEHGERRERSGGYRRPGGPPSRDAAPSGDASGAKSAEAPAAAPAAAGGEESGG